MPHLLAAPDKFRGTATATAVAAAVAGTARRTGWTADEAPLADGGEGTLEALGGTARHRVVAGPLDQPVLAEWRMLDQGPEPTAVVETAEAAGRALLADPTGDDALRATTTGVGQLVLAAVAAGARRIVVGAGGSATTDGGWGAVCAIGSIERLDGARLVVACDVETRFREAAAVFGPQKGASPEQVVVLGRRLDLLAARYRHQWGVDVAGLAGSGAAGGLAGGLAALGATLVPGFALVARAVGLERRLTAADLVVTGEGQLDETSARGKVVGGVAAAARGRAPVLCVVGEVAPGLEAGRLFGHHRVEVVSLVEAVGRRRAHDDTLAAVGEVVRRRLERWPR